MWMSKWEQGERYNLKEAGQQRLFEDVSEQSLGASQEGSLMDKPWQERSRKKGPIATGSEQGVFLEDLAAGSQCGWSRMNEPGRSLGQRNWHKILEDLVKQLQGLGLLSCERTRELLPATTVLAPLWIKEVFSAVTPDYTHPGIFRLYIYLFFCRGEGWGGVWIEELLKRRHIFILIICFAEITPLIFLFPLDIKHLFCSMCSSPKIMRICFQTLLSKCRWVEVSTCFFHLSVFRVSTVFEEMPSLRISRKRKKKDKLHN